jgi:zinc protease
LPNGVVITAKETRKTPAVAIHAAVRAGSVCDPVQAPGSAYLLARVIDRGTATRSAADIAESLESRGISLDIGVNRHLFSVVCTCLAEDFEPVLALLGDVLTVPSLPDQELATRKGETVTAIRQDEDSPAVQAVEGLMALLYGKEHPYGRPLKGTVDSVEAITREGLRRLHAERFTPGELSAVVVGDVDAMRAVDVARRVFGAWAVPQPLPVPIASPVRTAARRRIVVPIRGKSQTDIAYGFTTIRRSDPSYYACWLMNNVLGQYAMGGRLGTSIRERQGMAYSVSSVLDANIVEGPLLIRAGVSPTNVERAIASIDQELVQLRRECVTVRELNESRQYLIGSMPRALETNAGIANFLQTAEFFGLGLDYDVRLPDLLRAVTVEDVSVAIDRFVDPDRATIVIAGPHEA